MKSYWTKIEKYKNDDIYIHIPKNTALPPESFIICSNIRKIIDYLRKLNYSIKKVPYLLFYEDDVKNTEDETEIVDCSSTPIDIKKIIRSYLFEDYIFENQKLQMVKQREAEFGVCVNYIFNCDYPVFNKLFCFTNTLEIDSIRTEGIILEDLYLNAFALIYPKNSSYMHKNFISIRDKKYELKFEDTGNDRDAFLLPEIPKNIAYPDIFSVYISTVKKRKISYKCLKIDDIHLFTVFKGGNLENNFVSKIAYAIANYYDSIIVSIENKDIHSSGTDIFFNTDAVTTLMFTFADIKDVNISMGGILFYKNLIYVFVFGSCMQIDILCLEGKYRMEDDQIPYYKVFDLGYPPNSRIFEIGKDSIVAIKYDENECMKFEVK